MVSIPVMPWGRYRGEPISTLDAAYLGWVLEKATFASPLLLEAVREELALRVGRGSSPPIAGCWKPCPDTQIAAAIVGAGRKVLARQHHPDLGGSTARMQVVNAAADWLDQVVSR